MRRQPAPSGAEFDSPALQCWVQAVHNDRSPGRDGATPAGGEPEGQSQTLLPSTNDLDPCTPTPRATIRRKLVTVNLWTIAPTPPRTSTNSSQLRHCVSLPICVSPGATCAISSGEENNHLAGFSAASWAVRKAGITAYVETIEVLPDLRGQGIGSALLRRVELSAAAAGVQIIWLHVDARNAGAIRLYEALQYLCDGSREDFYPDGNAALIYRKQLLTAPLP